MGRRRQKNQLGLLVVVLLLAFWAVTTIVKNVSPIVLIAGIVGVGAIVTRKLLQPGRSRKSAIVKVGSVIERHIDPLTRQRMQLVRSDAYGKVLLDKWNKEVEYFITHHITPVLTAAEHSALRDQGVPIARMVSERVEAAAKTKPLFEAFSDKLTPTNFEIFCAEQLRSSGWNASVTRQSRDQGVDVIAEKSGIRVVLQCKLYSNPVGNKAVQEIVAGRGTSKHTTEPSSQTIGTPQRRTLASTNGVLLLHHSDLVNLENLIVKLRWGAPTEVGDRTEP